MGDLHFAALVFYPNVLREKYEEQMKAISLRWMPRFGLTLLVSVVAVTVGTFAARAQKPLEPEQNPNEKSNIASVEVTPATGTTTIGSKMQFKAVAKDASGQTLPDAVKYWYAAP